MYLLGLGVILLFLKWQEIGFVAGWSWWWVLSPFAGAMIWWTWADLSGHTKRKAMERDDERKRQRIERQRQALGQKPRSARRR